MRDEALAEERFLAREGTIDELVGQHESAGRQLLAEGADRADRNDLGHARAFQRVDVGAVIDVGGREFVAAAVARQEDDLLPAERCLASISSDGAPKGVSTAIHWVSVSPSMS